MTTSEWAINITLVLLVLRQLRPAAVDRRFVLVPVGLVGVSVAHYLTAVPTAGNDLLCVGVFAAAGVALGVLGGLLTRVRRSGGQVTAQASLAAATLWVVSMSARIGFVEWATHGGSAALTRFSMNHDLTSAAVWTVSFLSMAVLEVVVRLGTIVVRSRTLAPAPAADLAFAA